MKNRLLNSIGNLPRFWKRLVLMAFDAVALSFALWAGFSMRYGSWTPPRTGEELLIIATAPIVAIPIFIRLGLYRAVIRYLPERAIWRILQATTLAALGWVLLVFLSEMAGRGLVPRSVPILYWAIATMLIGSSRFLAKKALWSTNASQIKFRPILIYGAGNSGAQLVNALRREGTQRIVGFIDDNRALHGRDVAGLRVFSPASLPNLISQYGIEEVILSAPNLSKDRRQEIVASVAGHGAKVRTIPAVSDLVDGKYLVSQVKEIDIDELLGRSSVPSDPELIRQMVEGKTILVTGAGGSIGSELCRLIVKWAPQRLVLFEANEFALYQIDRELRALHDPAIVPVLGSIVDSTAVRRAIQNHGVQIVFHAAAHKHVPLVEANALEGLRNNVFGTRTVVDTAFHLGVERFVLISSDKAVRPTNVMGATKRWAELIVQEKAIRADREKTGQLFCAVRFGNVLGSNGSVVPLFKEQIAHGGPVTLTDPQMTRYFMSIHEAAELIVQAGALSEGGGDVFLLDMGEPVLIRDLATNMINLAGFSVKTPGNPDGEIEIVVTGKRPGEKMYEELFYDDTNVSVTRQPKIMRSLQQDTTDRDVLDALAQLEHALLDENEVEARRILFNFIRQ
ncbi:capsular biosynthesis protein [Devosia chinhatensis]|uniref:Capsular biosynthesis protein n=2 Tax=Devosia chinhatensis TaxID=429727 RepID=A0A0F5FL03_9HYPH|nr:capsular biosynthesis protein [Devosia chinhatensis]